MFFKKKLKQIRGFFSKQFRKQRWLLVVFSPEGLELRPIIYYPTDGTFKEMTPFMFKNIFEKNFSSKKIIKILGKTIFFPFKFNITVVASKEVCASTYFVFPFTRQSSNTIIEKNDVMAAFSQHLWKYLDVHKKAFAKHNDYDDLGVLLVANQVIRITVDDVPLKNPETLFEKKGKKISFGMIQTFLHRPLFVALTKTFSKRATFKHFHEYGFTLPLFGLISLFGDKKNTSNKHCIVARVEDSDTLVYAFDGNHFAYFDSFAFGEKYLYEAVHHVMGVNFSSYKEIINSIVMGKTSLVVAKKFVSIMDKELSRLSHGLQSFKKDIRATSALLSMPGSASFLALNKKFASMLISADKFECGSAKVSQLSVSDQLKADIICMIGLDRTDSINTLATRQIRWLIPHNMNVK